MKKTLLTIIASLAVLTVTACPKPTSHCIIALGCTYDYSLTDKVNSKDNIGLGGRIGYEIPTRFLTISAVGNYMFGSKVYNVGGEVSVNPLGINYGYDSPINFEVIAGVGYNSKTSLYTNVGLELTMSMEHGLKPFARATFNMNNLLDRMEYGVTACVGLRVSLGKGW